jgi:hypothetical protein
MSDQYCPDDCTKDCENECTVGENTTLREVLEGIKDIDCPNCKHYGLSVEDCFEISQFFCKQKLIEVESALKEWVGSGVMSDEEKEVFIQAYVNDPDVDISNVVNDVSIAQALKDKLEYEGKMQELQAKIDIMKSSVIVVDFDKHKVDFTTIDELKKEYVERFSRECMDKADKLKFGR